MTTTTGGSDASDTPPGVHRRHHGDGCGARRMVDGAAWLVDRVLPQRPIRRWVLSFPFPLRFLFATRPALIGRVMGIIYRVI